MTAHAAQALVSSDPSLVSASIDGPAEGAPGDSITLSYSATDDDATLSSIFVRYNDSLGRASYWLVGRDLPLEGHATISVPQGLPNERLQAWSVILVDNDGVPAAFLRSGVVCNYGCGQPGGHSVDISALDVTVGGSTPDVDVPEIASVSATGSPVSVGGTARVDLDLNDANPRTAFPIPLEAARLVSSTGHSFTLRAGLDGYGNLTGVVPGSIPNGTYSLERVSAVDGVGNGVTYRADGSVTRTPETSTGPTSHSLDLRAVSITVTGSTVDVTPPTVTALTYPTTTLTSGASGTVGFTGSDDVSGIAALRLEFGPTADHWVFDAAVSGGDTATGQVPPVSAGTWTLHRFTVTDAAGNYATYYASGAVHCNRTCTASHDIDFSALQARVISTPSAPSSVQALPGDGSARVTWSDAPNSGGTATTGYTVSVSPGGKTYNTSASSRAITIGGLSNNVRHTFTVRARNAVGLGAGLSNFATPRQDQRLFAGGDANHDGRPDIMAVSKAGTTHLYRGTGTGKVRTAVKIGSALPATRLMSNAVWRSSEDLFTGSSIGVDYSGRLAVYYNSYPGGALKLAAWPATSVFQKYRMVAAPGDLTGDGMADVLGITDAGDLYLHKARTDYTAFYSPKRIGGGWGAFTSVVGVGDLNGDRRNDLVTRKKDGTLWLYAGNGRGGFYAKQIGSSTSWKYYAQLSGVGDFNGDRRNDLLAVTPGGTIYLFKGNGRGGFSAKSTVASGFSGFL